MLAKRTEAEQAAIDRLKAAIQSLPKSLWFETDNYGGVVAVWKRIKPGLSHGVATIRCASKIKQ